MAKLEAIVTVMTDKRIVAARGSLCHEVILASREVGSNEDKEAELRDAINRHTRQRHCLAKLE